MISIIKIDMNAMQFLYFLILAWFGLLQSCSYDENQSCECEADFFDDFKMNERVFVLEDSTKLINGRCYTKFHYNRKIRDYYFLEDSIGWLSLHKDTLMFLPYWDDQNKACFAFNSTNKDTVISSDLVNHINSLNKKLKKSSDNTIKLSDYVLTYTVLQNKFYSERFRDTIYRFIVNPNFKNSLNIFTVNLFISKKYGVLGIYQKYYRLVNEKYFYGEHFEDEFRDSSEVFVKDAELKKYKLQCGTGMTDQKWKNYFNLVAEKILEKREQKCANLENLAK